MTLAFADPTPDSIPLTILAPDGLSDFKAGLDPIALSWLEAQGFAAAASECLTLPAADGSVRAAIVGIGDARAQRRGRFLAAKAASALPKSVYHLASAPASADLAEFALGWLLEGYRFTRYKASSATSAGLVAPDGVDAARIVAIAEGEVLTRDLINTPANDMGPAELEAAAAELAGRHGAKIGVIAGADLLEANFPLIHTVGRAAAPHRAPRLIDMTWGEEGPPLVLVGKGVVFDTGGLNIKPGASMGLMKKDMGGAATVLGLAHMIMALGLKLRLRVLIPAVENAISGDAYRPSDVLTGRNGLTVEINNTDAEGRLVLADALALAAEGEPALTVSMATLTGAARVAVGSDLSPFFAQDDADAVAIAAGAGRVADPVWRMPFHDPYEKMIEPAIADVDNAPGGGMAGAITAALFLRRFAPDRYVHFDIHGWQPSPAPARPKGGVGMGARAILDALPDLLGL